MTAAVLLMLLLVTDAGATSDAGARTDAPALRARVSPAGLRCRRGLRVRLSLENTSDRPIWIALERPSKEPIEWLRYSYFYSDTMGLQSGGVVGGGVVDRDVLAFLRSGESTRLDAGSSATWLLQLGDEPPQLGRLEVTVDGPLQWTADLGGSDVKSYAFEAKLALAVRRAGRCYAARRTGTAREPD